MYHVSVIPVCTIFMYGMYPPMWNLKMMKIYAMSSFDSSDNFCGRMLAYFLEVSLLKNVLQGNMITYKSVLKNIKGA